MHRNQFVIIGLTGPLPVSCQGALFIYEIKLVQPIRLTRAWPNVEQDTFCTPVICRAKS